MPRPGDAVVGGHPYSAGLLTTRKVSSGTYLRWMAAATSDRRWPIRWGPHAHIDNAYDLTPTQVKLFIGGRFRCVDCQTCTLCTGQYYMVKNEVWAAAGLGPVDGMLCLDCLGQRIGREVAYDDFTEIVPSCWFVRWPAPSSLAEAGVHTTP